MTKKFITAAITAVLALTLTAQVVSAQSNPPPSRADLEHTIQILQRQVESQQDRVQTITDKLKATDSQVERRIERVLGYLVTVTDSEDSRTKVLRAKEDMFDGLKRNIDFYANERGTRFAALYQPYPRLAKADLAEDVRRLDDRLERRVDQALALVASLPAEKDVARYQYSYEDGDLQQRTNPQYTHQNRAMSAGGLLREKAFKGLKTSLDNLQRRQTQLERDRPTARTDQGREFVDELRQRTAQLLEKRRAQIADAQQKSNPAGQALGKQAANDLVAMIEQERADYKKDQAEWIRLKNERDVERERLQIIQTRLKSNQRQLDRIGESTSVK